MAVSIIENSTFIDCGEVDGWGKDDSYSGSPVETILETPLKELPGSFIMIKTDNEGNVYSCEIADMKRLCFENLKDGLKITLK